MEATSTIAALCLALGSSLLVTSSAVGSVDEADGTLMPVEARQGPSQLAPADRSWIPDMPTELSEFMTLYVINDTYLESWGSSRLVSANPWPSGPEEDPFDSVPCEGTRIRSALGVYRCMPSCLSARIHSSGTASPDSVSLMKPEWSRPRP
jgi:hypothetical protein